MVACELPVFFVPVKSEHESDLAEPVDDRPMSLY